MEGVAEDSQSDEHEAGATKPADEAGSSFSATEGSAPNKVAHNSVGYSDLYEFAFQLNVTLYWLRNMTENVFVQDDQHLVISPAKHIVNAVPGA